MTAQPTDLMYKVLVQGVVDYAIYLLTPEGIVANWNAGAQRAKGYTAEEIVGQHFSVFYSAADRAARLPEKGLEIARERGHFQAEGWRYRKDGSAFWSMVVIDALHGDDGTLLGFAKVTRDITERRKAQELVEQQKDELARLSSFLEVIVANIPSSVIVEDAVSRSVLLVNRQAERLFGIAPQQWRGQQLHQHLEARVADYLDHVVDEAMRSGAPFRDEGVLPTALGPRSLRTTGQVILGADPRSRYVLLINDDVTDERAATAQIHHMAHHDILTGLPNRALFRQRLDTALASPAPSRPVTAVLCLDMDNFKRVNDALGHGVGDALLRALASRLRQELREHDLLARLGGDEFAVVLPGLAGAPGAAVSAQRLIDAVRAPFLIDGHTVSVGLSIGIALAPGDHDTGDQLLRCADMALYEAKRNGRNRFEYFRLEMDEAARRRRAIEMDLREAIAKQQLELYYQPIIDMGHNTVTGYEALIRWPHPQRGLVMPLDFIPIAEETGLIHDVGALALHLACREAASWQSDQTVAVNLSPIQFKSGRLQALVVSALAESGLAPQRLELEITESVLLDDSEGNIQTLKALKALGVRIALDDFGTGYSSLSYLRSFPFDKIKIDKSFVHDMHNSRESLAIIRAITGMSRSLEIQITAEGVETREQYDRLRGEGCSHFQGYLFGRPVPAAQRVKQL
ncbi:MULTISPECIES: bifunctional diguanylate cyclase/phosphodiesterase [unclassified Pseudomonas]|uniref:putative bifunctional diguanylate cyclase/phosphodiesterase n=1 Tax=unclassified Pseudomonas TaxID=196821 RepID=UPI000BCEFC04|nr:MULTISPECIES: EAL domain-containing protein [unclassified Pseudomonas]PVZ20035.1 PAS domain S-box-containing protein/diguanylate cyclase (GGDEF)-like protein [Pseudomonas sp. URIL14HWK12:I12]PVZ27101.1 PAS domain S-box-containing protein/diguanylate cyclase (GGDEF)-like protein [Pseudomonas sp. URIL14HWK12:I10]PVZ37990.1 PAS domain S-box-containing protein/diguanylate cyclase (GGDEF)-like protein [Pseudomonas sp. URIL14HWK12:I11]SNZ04887.1 PAS domain S-box-containing protein/diguanylate cycl